MPFDPASLPFLLRAAIAFHAAVLAAVLFSRTVWRRKAVWTLVVISVPLLGPLYWLLFRHEWEKSAATAGSSPQALPRHHSPIGYTEHTPAPAARCDPTKHPAKK